MKAKLFLLITALAGAPAITWAQEHLPEKQLQNTISQAEIQKRKENKVKSVEELSGTRYLNQPPDSFKTFSRTIREFDANGNLLNSAVYFNDQLLLTSATTYNANNLPTEKSLVSTGKYGSVNITFEYDVQGRKVLETASPANGEIQKTEWIYDQNGMLATEVNDMFLYTQTFSNNYNNKAQRTKTIETHSEYPEIEWVNTFDYDKSGNLVMQKRYRTDLGDTAYCYAVYNEKGNMVELNSVDLITESKQLFTWSTSGLLLKKQEWFKFPGQEYKFIPDYTEEREYDLSGNLVKTISTETASQRVTVVQFNYLFYGGN